MSPDDPRLTAYLLGELGTDESQVIAAAIAESPELQAAAQELKDLIGKLDDSASLGGMGDARLSDHQQDSILAAAQFSSPQPPAISTDAVASDATVRSENPSGAGRMRWLRLATAACILFAIGGTAIFLYRPNETSRIAGAFGEVLSKDSSEESQRLESLASGSRTQREETSSWEARRREQMQAAKDMVAEVPEFDSDPLPQASMEVSAEDFPSDALQMELGGFDSRRASGDSDGFGTAESERSLPLATRPSSSSPVTSPLEEEKSIGGMYSGGPGGGRGYANIQQSGAASGPSSGNSQAAALPRISGPSGLSFDEASGEVETREALDRQRPSLLGGGEGQSNSGLGGGMGGGMAAGGGYGGEGMEAYGGGEGMGGGGLAARGGGMGMAMGADASNARGANRPTQDLYTESEEDFELQSNMESRLSNVNREQERADSPTRSRASSASRATPRVEDLASNLSEAEQSHPFGDSESSVEAEPSANSNAHLLFSMAPGSTGTDWSDESALEQELVASMDDGPAIRVIQLLSQQENVSFQLSEALRNSDRVDATVAFPEGQEVTKSLAIRLAVEALGANVSKRGESIWLDVSDSVRESENKEKEEKVSTWRPATATPNAARLSVGHHDDLTMAARDTYVKIDGYRARVLLDYYYFNDRPQQLEGSFKIRMPADASLHYFAFGAVNVNVPSVPTTPAERGKGGEAVEQVASIQDRTLKAIRSTAKTAGADLARRAMDAEYRASSHPLFKEVKTARIVEKQKAALAYEETVRRRVDPALVEWSGPGIFQTKVFPLLPNRMHRIVIGYDVSLKEVDGTLLFDLDLPEEQAGGRVEFDVAATPGSRVTLTPDCQAFLSGERAYYRFDVTEARDYSVRVEQPGPILLTSSTDTGEYFATRTELDLPDQPVENDSDHAVFLLDTSWSQQAGAFHRWLGLIDEILSSNEKEISKFNVLFFNVEQRLWKEASVANTQENRSQLQRDCETLVLEGATDIERALASAVDYCRQTTGSGLATPNLFLLSDGAATWGQSDLASLAEPLLDWHDDLGESGSARGGALFCYDLKGVASDKVVLRHLAAAAGGSVFDVADGEAFVDAAKAHLSRPWTLESVVADGASDILAGGQATVYPQQKLEIAGKGTPGGPIILKLRRGDETKVLTVSPTSTVRSSLAERIYGGQAVEQLEPLGDEFNEVIVAYSRQFRVPGRVCSMVMLESEADYARFKIDNKEDPLVVKTTSVPSLVRLANSNARELRADPKRSFVKWIESLETASTPLLKRSTALQLAIEQMPSSAFDIVSDALACEVWQQQGLDPEYLHSLQAVQPDLDIILSEADQRLIKSGAADALKVASTAVEANPADPSTLRIVAFNAIHWNRSDQAAHLLRRLSVARPYQPQSLLLLARCFSDSGKADAAMVCYELVASGLWNQRWQGNRPIAELSLLHLLEEIEAGAKSTSVPAYASARLSQLREKLAANGLDLVVVMHWNTDRTDVDLHVLEPSGEECYYKHKKTRAGGTITQDITEGLGPEMYKLKSAPVGEFDIRAKYFRSDANVTKAPTATLVTVYKNLGRPGSSARTKVMRLTRPDQKIHVMKTSIHGKQSAKK